MVNEKIRYEKNIIKDKSLNFLIRGGKITKNN